MSGIALAPRGNVELAETLDRCCGLEVRSAALYRSFAAAAQDRPDLCALWTELARNEDEHVRVLNAARWRVPTCELSLTHLSTRWDQILRDFEAKLSAAEALSGRIDADQQLAFALGLEMSEIESLRQMLVGVTRRRPPRPIVEDHALRLADAAERFSAHPEVLKQVAQLRIRVSQA